VREEVEAGRLTVQQVDPAELSPGEFTHAVCTAVERGARLIVIDSLNGYLQAMPDERFLTAQMHELLTYLNQRGVVTMLLMAQHGFMGAMSSPVDVSYLADTVVLLRYFEAGGAIRRAISVVKKRTGRHEDTIREMRLSASRGVEVGEPLKAFRGVLTGVPVLAENAARTGALLGVDDDED
jgi:circadian clock protein KaiC